MRLEELKTLQDKLEHLCGGVYHGRSALEVRWGRDSMGINIEELIDIYPQRLSYAANGWRVHLYDEAGNDVEPRLGLYPGVDIRTEFPDRFIIHEPRTLGAVIPTRQGLGRVLVWCAMFWKWNARDWMAFAELFAKPWRVGYYAKNSDTKDIAALKSQMASMSGYSTAVFAEGTKPEFLWPQGVGANDIHGNIDRKWESTISKVVNGANLDSDGSGGSRARDEVKERTEFKLIAKDGNALEETMRRDLICPLIRKQFGEDAARTLCPTFRLNTEPPKDENAQAARVFAFIDRNGEIDADEFREKFTGLSKPAKGAVLLKPMQKQAAQPEDAQNPDETDPKDKEEAK